MDVSKYNPHVNLSATHDSVQQAYKVKISDKLEDWITTDSVVMVVEHLRYVTCDIYKEHRREDNQI